MMFQTALLMLFVGYGIAYPGYISQGDDLLITPDECEIVVGLIEGDRCFVEYSTIQPGNASDPSADLLITSHGCELVDGLKVDGRCWINPLTMNQNPDKCPHTYLKTASGCIGMYFNASCLPFQNGLKVDNLCVIIKKAPEVEAKPEPLVPQYIPENAVIIPNATYQKDSDNGFKPLTQSENYYVQSVCGQATAPRARIVNGKVATKGQFPWAIDLGGCSGMLISPRHVLTAAHCYIKGSPDHPCSSWSEKSVINKPVGYGGVCRSDIDNDCPNGTDIKMATINRVMYAHGTPPKCIEFNDIAIVQLNEDIEFNDYVKPICLSKLSHDNMLNVKTLGFGYTDKGKYSNVLHYMATNITRAEYQRELTTLSRTSSPCSGDSGGPTQASFNGSSRTYLAGIHSRSYCMVNKEATGTFVPGYVDWVCQQTGNASCLPFQNGLKVDNLCVIIKKAPEVEMKPEPKVPQYSFDDAVIIPNATYQKDSDNGFKPLTKSENYYVQSVCGQATAPRARIFNGKIAINGQFPWIVNLDYCTGILISPRHVLTAAHCFYSGENAEDFGNCKPVGEDIIVNFTSVWYGGVCKWDDEGDCPNDMKLARIKRVMYGHDNPSVCVVHNDIAIVLLDEDIEFNDFVKPICLGSIAHDKFVNVKTAGFGLMDEYGHQTNVLRYINTNIVKQKKREMDSKATDGSTCQGDSGGPTQASFNGSSRTYLAGITSRGICSSDGDTTSTFVPTYVDWVCSQTGVCDLS
uniref:Peptidase S1 domain-containing protein n=1 Tax=Panagrellus redivivus TaxID=6233 RepID=A0A7E4UZK6_PANRE